MKGRAFRMLKFTTMRPDAQSLEFDLQHLNQREGPWFKIAADKDPRLTRSGRWIRKLTINEIPQFWNVLKGDMSLVGPRPPTPEEVATYLQFDVRYFQVLDAKPGMTGLWQVTARHDPSFERRLDLDLRYIREWTVWRDLAILFRTFAVVFDRES
jgi:lipopolysaccharide/colanic/teichoic acid biosynthesis glycosyltransferase